MTANENLSSTSDETNPLLRPTPHPLDQLEPNIKKLPRWMEDFDCKFNNAQENIPKDTNDKLTFN